MTSHVDDATRPAPLGGPLFTRTALAIAAIAAIGMGIIAWRFAAGLGRTTGLSDGFPWGIWIAYDVVTGTAVACGGYGVAILVYVLNRGRFHPLVRSAVLVSALGYTMAGLSVAIDVGRPWNAWRLAQVWRWNHTSVLLEVALCITTYMLVLWVELLPVFLERFDDGRWPRVARFASRLRGPLDKAMPWILALGMVLPTMHQSSLGSLLLIARTKLHPLWHTPILPLLFLVSVVAMGYAAVVCESAISALALGRKPETRMLSKLAALVPPIVGVYLVLRVGDLAMRGRLGLVLSSGRLGAFFVAELALLGGGALLLLPARRRTLSIAAQFRGAVLLVLGGTLYRFDAFLVAYNPGAGWHYFPTAPEILVTVGIVALEVLAYGLFIKRFPILTGQQGLASHPIERATA